MQKNRFYLLWLKREFSIKLLIAIIAICLLQNAQAQQSDLKIEAMKIPLAGDTWETTLMVAFSTLAQNGILIETPKELRLIPVSIARDNKQLWLQNSDRRPDGDSILTWQMNDSGFFLYFNTRQTFNQSTLSITCIAHLLTTALAPGSEIRIRPFTGESGNRQILPQVIAAQDVGSVFIK